VVDGTISRSTRKAAYKRRIGPLASSTPRLRLDYCTTPLNMTPRPFKPLDIEDVLSKLTLNEKTRLLAGIDNVRGKFGRRGR
jgi:hypothetical protein